MKFGYIGAGRMGSNLAFWMKRSGWNVSGLYDIDEAKSRKAARFIPCGVFSDIPRLIDKVDTIFIAVPDDKIAELVDLIAEHKPRKKKILVHTSGVHSAEILAPAGDEYIPFALHPFQTIKESGFKNNPFRRITWGAEGSDEFLPIASSMVKNWEGMLVKVDPAHKALYHAAACFGSNLLLSNIVTCVELLEASGFEEKEAIRATTFIARQLLNNISKHGICKSITGPAARDDCATLAKHIIALGKTDKLKLYEEVTKNLLNTIKSCNKESDTIAEKLFNK
ncbi:DUF2520 domain-containing protein [bacterium]|nr:DUF2520 domain-containing protein [bacterium]